MNKKKIITDVLFNFYNTNLASEAAREWIADEIIKKLDNPEHEIRDVLQSEPIKKGHFEEYLSNGGPSVEIEERKKSFKSQIENNRLQKESEVEVKSTEPVTKTKVKPKPKNKVSKKRPTKNLKNIRKPRGKFL